MILSMQSLFRWTYVNSCKRKIQSGKLNSAPGARGWFLGRSGNSYSFSTCPKGDTTCLLCKGSPFQIPIGHCKDHLKSKYCYSVFAGKTGLSNAVLYFGYEILTGMELSVCTNEETIFECKHCCWAPQLIRLDRASLKRMEPGQLKPAQDMALCLISFTCLMP